MEEEGPKETEKVGKANDKVKEYLNNATIHGLSNIAQSNNSFVKCIWGIVFLGFFTASIYTCYEILRDFLKYEAHLVHKYHSVKSLAMPSITICNANNYQAHKLKQYLNSEMYVNQLINQSLKSGIFLPVALYVGVWTIGTNNVSFIKETRSGSEKLFANDLDGWCTFQTFINCTKRDFIDSFYHSYFGICKTFNSDGKYLQKGTGPLSGLSMKFFIDAGDYAPMTLSDMGAGVTLMVHPSNVFPDPLADAVLLQPGTLSRITMKRQVHKRLRYPYPSRCVDRNGTALFPGKYTISNCHMTCIQHKMYEKCGILEAVVTYNLQQRGINVPHKLDKNVSKVQELCIINFYDDVLNNKIPCNCPLPCKEEIIKTKVSSSKWPTKADMKYYRPVLANILNKKEVSEEFIYDNMLAVQIFFDSMSYEEIIEVEAISKASLFANIGGAVGLFIGGSCYSLVEFLVFIIKAMVDCGKSAAIKPSKISSHGKKTDN